MYKHSSQAPCVCVFTVFRPLSLPPSSSSQLSESRSSLNPHPAPLCSCSSSLALPELGASAGGVWEEVREARPPEQGGAGGDDQQALQGGGVVGRSGAAAKASSSSTSSSGDAVYERDGGTGVSVGVGAAPAVLTHGRRAADG